MEFMAIFGPILPALVLVIGVVGCIVAVKRAMTRARGAGRNAGLVGLMFVGFLLAAIPCWLLFAVLELGTLARDDSLAGFFFLFIDVPTILGVSTLSAGLASYGMTALWARATVC